MKHLTKAQKQERKRYRQNQRDAVKKMKAIIKDYGPWDYGFLMDMIGVHLKHMQQYYHQGYNVMAVENTGIATRAEIADQACALWDEWDKYANHYDTLSLSVSMKYHAEDQAMQTLFNYLGIYLPYLWD